MSRLDRIAELDSEQRKREQIARHAAERVRRGVELESFQKSAAMHVRRTLGVTSIEPSDLTSKRRGGEVFTWTLRLDGRRFLVVAENRFNHLCLRLYLKRFGCFNRLIERPADLPRLWGIVR